MSDDPASITELLERAAGGGPEAREELAEVLRDLGRGPEAEELEAGS